MHCSCISIDVSDCSTTEINCRVSIARKEHGCDECKCTIEPGEVYESYTGRGEYMGFFTHKTCADCLSVRKAFFCDGWAWGRIWEEVGQHVDDTWGEISSECLLELTPGALESVLDMIDELWEEDDDDEV